MGKRCEYVPQQISIDFIAITAVRYLKSSKAFVKFVTFDRIRDTVFFLSTARCG